MANASGYYEICVSGRLGRQAAIWFEDMTLTVNEETTPPQTIIQGYLADQTALYGLIARIRDLGLTLESIKRLEGKAKAASGTKKGDAYDSPEDRPLTNKD